MNLATNKTNRLVLGVVGLFGACSMASNASANGAGIITLNDNNARVFIDPSSQAGAYDWFVDTQDYLAKEWFWYRVGNSAEQSIDTLTFVGSQQLNPFQATIVYTNSSLGFDLTVDYSLDGGALGSGNADLGEQIKINNHSGGNLDLHLFLYTDFDLAGTGAGDTVTQLFNSPIGYISATQIEGSDLNQTTVSRGGNRIEASIGNGTLLKLNNGVADNLSNTAAPVGPGDVNYTFQWDQTIANGGSFLVSVDKRLDITPIPEPTAGALGFLGMAALVSSALRRRV